MRQPLSPLRLDQRVAPGQRFLFGMLVLLGQIVLGSIATVWGSSVVVIQLMATLGLLLPPLILVRAVGASVRHSFALFPIEGSQWFWCALIGLALVPPMALLGVMNSQWIEMPPEFLEAVEELLPDTPVEWVLTGALICLLVPLAEELLFRGLLQEAAGAALGPLGAAVAIGLLFGAVHFEPWYLLPLSMIGLTLGYVRLVTGSVVACVIVHGAYNAGSLVLGRLATAVDEGAEESAAADLTLIVLAFTCAWVVWVGLGRLRPAEDAPLVIESPGGPDGPD